jgi:hypothetical protein
MRAEEIQAKATIVAALIAARAVELPSRFGDPLSPPDEATLRMRELTDHIYDVITASAWPEEGTDEA